MLYVETLDEVKAVVDYLNAYKEADTETPTIRKVESIYSFVPREEVQSERLAIIGEMRQILGEFQLEPDNSQTPERWQEYLATDEIRIDELPDGIRRLYTPNDGSEGYLVYIFNSVSMNKADLARQFSDDIREITIAGKSYHPAAEGLIFVDMLTLLKGETALAILLVTVTAFLVLLAGFRSLPDTLMLLAPTSAGLAILVGTMGLFDIRLSIMNVAILPSVIGIGVDNAIHILHRLRERPDETVLHVMNTTGRAALVTTVTTMLGFAGMLSADMAGLRSLGLLACIGFSACLLTTAVVLPAMLELQIRRRAARTPNRAEPKGERA